MVRGSMRLAVRMYACMYVYVCLCLCRGSVRLLVCCAHGRIAHRQACIAHLHVRGCTGARVCVCVRVCWRAPAHVCTCVRAFACACFFSVCVCMWVPGWMC